jgi:hypothetical protein
MDGAETKRARCLSIETKRKGGNEKRSNGHTVDLAVPRGNNCEGERRGKV